MTCMVDSLPFRVPVACHMKRELVDDVIGNGQNFVAVTVEFPTLSESRKHVPHVQYTIHFDQYVIQLVHCLFGVISQISKHSMFPML